MAQESYCSVKALRSALGQHDIQSDDRVTLLAQDALAIGPPHAPQTYVFDFASETLRSQPAAPSLGKTEVKARFDDRDLPPARAQRATGRYAFAHGEVEFARSSLADLLEAVLTYLERIKPGALARLSKIKKRTRRIVAREQRDLYDRAHLARDYAREISGGWWMGTNNSRDETRKWICHACDAAGIDYVTEIVIGF